MRDYLSVYAGRRGRTGDAIRALHDLSPKTPDTSMAVLDLLGFKPTPRADNAPVKKLLEKKPSSQSKQHETTPITDVDTSEKPQDRQASAEHSGKRKPIASRLIAQGDSDAIVEPDWLIEMEPFAIPDASTPAYRKPIPPLLEPRQSKAVLQRLISVSTETSTLDMKPIMSRITRNKPLTVLSRQRRPKLASRVQVLVDISSEMLPFSRDAAQLPSDIAALVGISATDVRSFPDHPLEGVLDPDFGFAIPYETPPSASTVLAITSFGVPAASRSRNILRWSKFQETLQTQCVNLVLLAVASTEAILSCRNAGLSIFQWDRHLSVQAANRQFKMK